MKWLDVHLRENTASDYEDLGGTYSAIAEVANEALDGNAMIQVVRDEFPNQKAFGEFLGVGESTVTGWMKNGSFPDYAKRATLAAFYSNKYRRQLKDARDDSTRSKVVKDGDRYLVVRFRVDEAGVAIGEVLARDIPNKDTALALASHDSLKELLDECKRLFDHVIDSRDPEDSAPFRELKDEISLALARAFKHDNLVERNRALNDLNLDHPSISISNEELADNGGSNNV
jgi:transcriptional regulator with XRE-family HTH domain